MAAMPAPNISRRSFLVSSAALPWALHGIASGLAASTSIPVGLELYSVRDELKKDPAATVRAVAQMGYQVVEFYARYFEWTEPQAKQMRKLLDDLGIHCYSTHNDATYFTPQNLNRVRDLNQILGCKYAVLAWTDPKTGVEGWKAVADKLNSTSDALASAGLKVGYHNHQAEFTGAPGQRPMDFLAKNTQPAVMLQLDVGTCLEAGSDPVTWIQANPGRIRSIHCKDWSPDPNVAYKTLFGEGKADWKAIFQAAEGIGGVEYYLIEQEGSRFPELETARRCLQAFRTTHV